MRKNLKRIAAAASAVVIGGVSCVTTWFSVPASAAAGFTWLEWFEFQSLLQGIGVGSSNSDFADSVQGWIDGIGGPEIYRSEYDEWMTGYEYYNRLGWDEIIDWFDDTFSGDDASYSDVADVGTDVSGGSTWSVDGWSTWDGMAQFTKSFVWDSSIIHERFNSYISFRFNKKYVSKLVIARYGSSDDPVVSAFIFSDGVWKYSGFHDFSNSDRYCFSSSSGSVYSNYQSISLSQLPIKSDGYVYFDSDDFNLFCSDLGLNGTIYKSKSDVCDHLNSGNPDWQPGKTGTDDFVGPVYSYNAAQDLYKSTGTAAGIRLDVQTQDGVPDLQAALDDAGVDTVDDLVAGVAAGTVPMSKVFSDAKVTPYVVADTTSGTVVTDLGVSATATGVKAVGLTQDLAVPKDLTNVATYVVKGKTWDPEMSKYKLPLFQYFPFCLPWDIYQVLAAFSADPVAPVFDIPVGKILSGVRSADVSKAASLSAKIDFGDDNWSKVFEIIRILECAGIIVGLCLVAVYLIHGGR